MPEDRIDHDPHPRGHETRDANVRVLLWFGAGMVVFLAVAHAVVFGVFAGLVSERDAEQPKLSRLQREDRPVLPRDLNEIPAPRLQQSDHPALEVLVRKHNAQLEGYGWIDEKEKVVRIPVERAMELLAERDRQAAARKSKDAEKGEGQ